MSNASTMLSKSICIMFVLALVSVVSTATASPSSLPDKILSCEFLLYSTTDCLKYLGKHSRYDYPSSTCCAMVKDARKVDPDCVKFEVFDGYINQRYVEFDRNTTRVGRISSACGVGSLKSNPPKASPLKATPPVAARSLKARPPVQPTQGSSASSPKALSRKSGDASSSSQNSSELYFGYFFWFFAMWAAFIYQ